LTFDGVKYEVGGFEFWEQAEEACNIKLAQLKAAKLREHKKKPITRNAEDIAVIDIKNKKGEVVGQALCDDSKWHELTQHSWNMSGNKLDERLANLTSSTSSSINQNHASKEGGSSRFRGVSWNKKSKKWEKKFARIKPGIEGLTMLSNFACDDTVMSLSEHSKSQHLCDEAIDMQSSKF